MLMNSFKRVVVFSLASLVAVGCSSATDQSTAPPSAFSVTISDVQARITTPGYFRLTVNANKPLTRVEFSDAAGRRFYADNPTAPYIFLVPVDPAKNGTQWFTGMAFAEGGEEFAFHSISVVVDIRWEFVYQTEGVRSYGGSLMATDATNAIYLAGTTEQHDVYLIKHDADGKRSWIRNYGGSTWEVPRSIGVDVSGRVFVAGEVFDLQQGAPLYDCFLTIFDASGVQIRTQGVTGDLIGHSSACFASSDGAGNFYVIGHTRDTTGGDKFLIKYDPAGNTLWIRKFAGEHLGSSFGGGYVGSGGGPTDEITGVVADASGNVYVAGSTANSFDGSPSRGRADTFLLKFDAAGNRLWARQYGTPTLATVARTLALGPGGDVYVAGENPDPATYESFYSTGNAVLLRYGSDGTLRWAKTLDGGDSDLATGVAADDRGIYLVGLTFGGYGPGTHDITEPSQGGHDIFLAKLSFDGNLLWVRLLGSPGGAPVSGLVFGANGDIYIGGYTTLARHRDAP